VISTGEGQAFRRERRVVARTGGQQESESGGGRIKAVENERVQIWDGTEEEDGAGKAGQGRTKDETHPNRPNERKTVRSMTYDVLCGL
jgi:hypothetical protein